MPLQQLQPSDVTQRLGQLPGLAAGGLVLVQARGLDDAEVAITAVRHNSTVVLRCEHLGPRLIDMVSGGVCAMDGRTHHISPQVVLFLPAAASLDCATPQAD
jgi:FtsZ-interacting cell division protein YlmF